MLRFALAAAVAAAAFTVVDAASASDRNRQTITFETEMPAQATATPAAAEVTYSQLVRDARRACRSNSGTPLEARRATLACAADLVEKVVAEANRPLLTAAHEGRTDQTIRLAERTER